MVTAVVRTRTFVAGGTSGRPPVSLRHTLRGTRVSVTLAWSLLWLAVLAVFLVRGAGAVPLGGSVEPSAEPARASAYGYAYMYDAVQEVSAGAIHGHDESSDSSARAHASVDLTLAAKAASRADGLLGKPGDIVVIGRQADTAVAKGWKGHVTLDAPDWSLKLNDEFIAGAIEQGRRVYLASPIKGNLVQTSGRYAGGPTIYARELRQLKQAGYVRRGDYLEPPG